MLLIAMLVAFTVCCCAYAAVSTPLGGDYPGPACRGCDFAGPPIEALATGHVGRFFATQPFMGSVTLLLRAPAVAVARAVGAGELAQYRVGCLICLLLAGGLLWVLVAYSKPRGKRWLTALMVVGLVLAGPVTTKALSWGHPEELVGALLCVVGVVFASRGRIVLAGVSLGLALATKQWALLAILPALIASPGHRRQLITITVGVGAVFVLPMLIGDPGRFFAQNLHAGIAPTNTDTFGVTPTNVWFAYGRETGAVLGPGGGTTYGIPATLAAVAHPLVFALGLGLPLVYWRRANGRSTAELLRLLALLFLLRCLLDPLTLSYHHLPFFVALASYEMLSRRKIPVLSIYSTAAIWALGKWIAPLDDAAIFNKLYLAWAVPVAAYLAYKSFTRPRSELLPTRPPRHASATEPAQTMA